MAADGKRARYKSRIVNLKPKNSEEPITIHEDTLRAHSPFFKAALDQKWKEGQSGEIDLPDDADETVEAYVDYLYTGRVVCNGPRASPYVAQPHLARLYVFGDKIQDHRFCNAVLSSILSRTDDLREKEGYYYYPGRVTVTTLYDGTPEGSLVRRMLVTMYAQAADPGWFSDAAGYPAQFLADVLREVFENKGPVQPSAWYERRETWFKKD